MEITEWFDKFVEDVCKEWVESIVKPLEKNSCPKFSIDKISKKPNWFSDIGIKFINDKIKREYITKLSPLYNVPVNIWTANWQYDTKPAILHIALVDINVNICEPPEKITKQEEDKLLKFCAFTWYKFNDYKYTPKVPNDVINVIISIGYTNIELNNEFGPNINESYALGFISNLDLDVENSLIKIQNWIYNLE